MKKALIAISMLLLVASCKATWDDEVKDAYIKTCMDDANTWTSPDKAKTYCNCMLEKIMKKYPAYADMLEHADSVIHDPELRKCREEVGK
jgi:hypothetical protein